MDFEKYYNLQAKSKIPTFNGTVYQRGHGFGDVFRKFFKWVVPIIKKNALPLMKKTGKKAFKSAAKTALKIASDTLEGQDLKTSAKNRIKESIDNFGVQAGLGYKKNANKKKRPNKHLLQKKHTSIKKRKLDIFD